MRFRQIDLLERDEFRIQNLQRTRVGERYVFRYESHLSKLVLSREVVRLTRAQ
jgi:hypothetical protein